MCLNEGYTMLSIVTLTSDKVLTNFGEKNGNI